MRDVFARRVMDKLQPPLIVDLSDLADAFCSTMRVAPDLFPAAYEIFVGNIDLNVLVASESPPFVVALADTEEVVVEESGETASTIKLRTRPPEWQDLDGGRTVWSRNGVSVDVVGIGIRQALAEVVGGGSFDGTPIFGVVRGVMSARRCRVVCAELSAVIPVLLLALGDGDPRDTLALLTRPKLEACLPSLQECLDSFYAASTAKDSLDRRMRNALTLLSEARRQTHGAVSLALTMSGMEAMLASGKDNISSTLAENTATLLEPEGGRRRAAEKVVKALYDKRSRLLHGESVEDAADAARRASVLATAAVRAITERRSFRHRLGDAQEAPADLFEAIRDARATATRVDGVTDSPARNLWSDATSKQDGAR